MIYENSLVFNKSKKHKKKYFHFKLGKKIPSTITKEKYLRNSWENKNLKTNEKNKRNSKEDKCSKPRKSIK